MINLSEETINYIERTFLIKPMIYKSFSYMEEFGLQFYEDSYIELISARDMYNADDLSDLFMIQLIKDLTYIIREHDIILNSEFDIELLHVLEIVSFLYLVQRREDYTHVSYIMNSEMDAKDKIISLILDNTLLNDKTLHEIIYSVDEKLIEAFKEMILDRTADEGDVIELDRVRYINSFRKFVGDTDCLGIKLYTLGYSNVNLGELDSLVRFDIHEYIQESFKTNKAQAALDVLSILICTKDNYKNPLEKLTENSELLMTDSMMTTSITHIIKQIMSDFNATLDATKILTVDS